MKSYDVLGDRVLVRQDDAEVTTESGLVIPDFAQERASIGTVVEVGQGQLLENGERVPPTLKVGDRVVFAKYGGTTIEVDDETLVIMAERDVYLRFTE